MRRLLALMMCAVSLGASAQITYPYNPDGNADTLIGVTDMQDLLSTYGQPFFPSEILVEGQTLTSVLMDLQHSIDSLSALSAGGGGSVLDMPIGTILPVASEAVPEGWVLCDGRELAIEDYQGLYDLIGTTYGAGDSAFWAQVFFPATTFNIPDLRGRTIIGANDMGGEQSDVLTIHQASAGQVGGEEQHQLTEEEMPEVIHDLGGTTVQDVTCNSSNQGCLTRGGTSSYWQLQPGFSSISNQGGDQPHNNMQPYMALNYMMKVQAEEDVIGALEELILAQQIQLDELLEGPTVYRASDLEGFVAEGFYRRILPDDADVILNDGSAMWILECPNSSQFRELIILSSTVNVLGQDMLLGSSLDAPSAGHYFLVDGTWTSN